MSFLSDDGEVCDNFGIELRDVVGFSDIFKDVVQLEGLVYIETDCLPLPCSDCVAPLILGAKLPI